SSDGVDAIADNDDRAVRRHRALAVALGMDERGADDGNGGLGRLAVFGGAREKPDGPDGKRQHPRAADREPCGGVRHPVGFYIDYRAPCDQSSRASFILGQMIKHRLIAGSPIEGSRREPVIRSAVTVPTLLYGF